MSKPIEVKRWTNAQGDEWVCGAYDHGPFCRLCQKVDGTIAACLSNVDDGFMEIVGIDPSGDLRLRVTEYGELHIKTMLQRGDV